MFPVIVGSVLAVPVLPRPVSLILPRMSRPLMSMIIPVVVVPMRAMPVTPVLLLAPVVPPPAVVVIPLMSMPPLPILIPTFAFGLFRRERLFEIGESVLHCRALLEVGGRPGV